tara:strand:+ start:323 stop:2131 length:1809 start_codon:yes stop_codon:yes gene_type:complete
MEKNEGGYYSKRIIDRIEQSIFSVPFSTGEIKEHLTINTNNFSNLSNEQIISHAIDLKHNGYVLEASRCYEYLINRDVNDYVVFINYGAIMQKLNKLKKAELYTRKAILLRPDLPISYYNLCEILIDLSCFQEAEVAIRKAIEINPNYSEAYNILGRLLKNLGRLQEAELSIRQAIKLNPIYTLAFCNLGIILRDIGKLDEAELIIRKAIALKPDSSNALSILGIILIDNGNLNEAENVIQSAIKINPNNIEANHNLVGLLIELGRINEAETLIKGAIKINPNSADSYFHLSSIQLLNEDYKSGLENYEFRFNMNKPVIPHSLPEIKKIKDDFFNYKTKMLVVSEQGFGDTLQFMRYIPYLRNQGFDISFSAQIKLHSLIKASGIDMNPLTPEQGNTTIKGQWISLLSLPKYLNVNSKNPIITDPYIFSTEKLIYKWKNIFKEENRPIVGINWQGDKNAEKGILKGRSIPLEKFTLIDKNNNVRFLSLQKGFGSEQIAKCSFKERFIKEQKDIDKIWDFLETAAIIFNCDLIITSDTSVAHLAGGMGKRVWLLLKKIPEWRWGLYGETTFWYPSLRLFRQKERNNWSEVIERVSIELRKELG